MITEDIIRDSYIRKIVTRDADRIYTTQVDVVRDNFHSERSNNLANFLSGKPFSIVSAPGKQVFHFRILSYLRFLDIWSSGRNKTNTSIPRNLELYNRVVWGILYRETLLDLKYGLTKDIRESIKAQLQSTAQL